MNTKKHHQARGFAAAFALGAVLITGCAPTAQLLGKDVSEKARELRGGPPPVNPPSVQQVDRLAPVGRSVELMDDRSAVHVNVQNASLVEAVGRLATQMGYGLTVTPGVNFTRGVTANFRAADAASAVRQLAWTAGSVAVINSSDRSITLAAEATMVFRVPSDALKTLSTNFKYGGAPIAGNPGGTGSASSGASSSSVSSEMTVQGTYGNTPQGFNSFLEELAGSNAAVRIYPETGLVSVRSNGQALKRVHDFLARYAYDSRRQVEIQARLVEVSLGNELRYGIQWDKVFSRAGNKITLNTLPSAAESVGSLSFTSASITSVIKALETITKVEVTSTPKLIVSNNSSATIFEGTQRPYVPQVQQTNTGATAGGTATTLSGQGAYASDGVQLAVHATILDDNNAVLTIVPSTITLGNLQKFLNDQISMYEQSVRNGGQRISIRSGETFVISGNRYSRGNDTAKGIPGFSRTPVVGDLTNGQQSDRNARETVLLISARILRPDPMDVIFSESI
jgi:type II secretory pathway component GspD/PulD (secretin)